MFYRFVNVYAEEVVLDAKKAPFAGSL